MLSLYVFIREAVNNKKRGNSLGLKLKNVFIYGKCVIPLCLSGRLYPASMEQSSLYPVSIKKTQTLRDIETMLLTSLAMQSLTNKCSNTWLGQDWGQP